MAKMGSLAFLTVAGNFPEGAPMAETNHRFVETNGIRMHVAEAGEGPLVILCHGFPECWYSWRHQLPALAAAGYHAVAPDQRGYGETDRPEPVEAYHILHLTADMVGLVHALGKARAIIVGHDWGAPVAWHCALLRPDLFTGVGLLSVPYLQRSWSDPRPTEIMRLLAGEQQFYQLYFQEPGKAEAELEADVRVSLATLLYSASGDPPPERRWRFLFGTISRQRHRAGGPSPLANRTGSRCLHRSLRAQRLPWRVELVPQSRSVVGADALPLWCTIAPAVALHRWCSGRSDHHVPVGLRRSAGYHAKSPTESPTAGRRTLDSAGTANGGQPPLDRVLGRSLIITYGGFRELLLKAGRKPGGRL